MHRIGHAQIVDNHAGAPVRSRGRFGIHVVERAPEHQFDQLRPRDLADRAGRDMRSVPKHGD